ncbi:ABC transporter ATP-binding protein [Leucobacter denitrificans]|uniref:ABC transporter ATP-binding protein n=1 Tax=Leucobacter denitrificans TaxID=683042 RepID=A0A7G9S2P5_9MICO|nr:ABC transporter ATP-binding protein [Leucobacter denitrificans]QNN62120.1 ABC transporter ATP-binding protein [Leucobacter denitrificans]
MDVRIDGLSLSYGDFHAVKNLDLDIAEGESLVLLGQSGCGKTSTMRCIAGLEDPNGGSISIGGKTVFDAASRRNLSPNKRNIGMVFQSYAIWPHMTVLENVSFPLRMKRLPKKEVRSKALETLEIVGLEHLAEKGASLLSGGQMQRVALARSLAMGPNVMLLDEPLSNLDARLREDLRVELRRIQLELGLTSVYVTHDQGEALALADRIAIMQHGRISQLAAPADIYGSPASASIATFLGMVNVFKLAPFVGGRGRLAEYELEVVAEGQTQSHTNTFSMCVRPENISMAVSQRTDSDNSWPGVIEVRLFQGAYTRWTVKLDAGPTMEVETRMQSSPDLHVGDRVYLEFDARNVLVLPDEVPSASSDSQADTPVELEGLSTRAIPAMSQSKKTRARWGRSN